ncbi:Dopamine receptor 1 [Hypsibius exemplaris]|uniref:Dopamine receptor 1 n=1 Tax=Hypsibius exemplaris TaxID=2072580 RepID=A0A1W0X0P4_HYPEX|nr:Dopamine receptor 1 [Hypsibius exemplaris]
MESVGFVNYSDGGGGGGSVIIGHKTHDGFSLFWHAAVAFLLTAFILIAVIGNILVCIAIYTDRNLRHIGNTFTASLALADLLVGLVVMPLALVNDLLGEWMLPQLLCGIWVSFDIMGSTASILNLCAISLDRYIHIKDPLHYNATVTTKVVVPAVLLVWILSTLISFVPLNLGWHRPQPHHITPHHHPDFANSSLNTGKSVFIAADEGSAAQRDPSNTSVAASHAEQCALEINPIYAVTSSIISFYFPCIVMLIIYSRLYMEARRHVKCLKETIPLYYHSVSTNNLSIPRNGNSGHHGSTQDFVAVQSMGTTVNSVSEHKAAVTLGIIVSVFLGCWAPFFVINIVHANCRCINNITFKALTWLGYCNSAFNPIIYSIFNQDFRKAFRKLLHFHVCFANNDGSPRSSGPTRERALSHAGSLAGTRTPNSVRSVRARTPATAVERLDAL